MIQASYASPRDEATGDDIHMRDSTAVYCTNNKIFSVSFPISSAEALCGCMPSVLSRRATEGSRTSGSKTTCLGGTHWATAMLRVRLLLDS